MTGNPMTTDRDAAAAAYDRMIRDNDFRYDVDVAFRAGWDAAMEWRSMENAPKDGTPIDVWVRWRGRVADVVWSAKRGWIENGEDDWGTRAWMDLDGKPEAWRHVPQPPASTGEGA